jgi:hypothetical protein
MGNKIGRGFVCLGALLYGASLDAGTLWANRMVEPIMAAGSFPGCDSHLGHWRGHGGRNISVLQRAARNAIDGGE